MQVGPVLVEGKAVDRRHKGPAVGQLRHLGDEIDHVLSEAVHAHIQPEAHNTLDLFADLGIVHVEVGLFFGKNVQIILSSLLVVLPREALELAVPVVGRELLLPFKARIPPDVVIAVRVVLALAALDEPFVLIRGVVDHQIQQHLEPELVCAVQHFFELVQRSVVGMYVFVIGNVISVIGVGRWIDGAEPDAVHAQALYVFELVIDAVQVADPVPVSVAEAPDPDLVKGHLSEIELLFHFLKRSSASVHRSSIMSFHFRFAESRDTLA